MIDLHHAGANPDWQNIKPEDRNVWQRIAVATKGILTPGNIASLIGLVLVLWGLLDLIHGNVQDGLIKIAAGRFMDLVDGAVAHATGTKNLLSEATDAIVDKIELVVGLPVLIQQGILPVPFALAIALQNLVNIILAFMARKRQAEIKPSISGKFATAVQWLAIVLYLVAASYVEAAADSAAQTSMTFAFITALLFVPLGIVATIGYIRDALSKRKAN